MENIKKFLKVAKNYINYIMKLEFKELFVNFIELIILVIISCLLLFPIDVVKELLFKIVTAITNVGSGLNIIYGIIFNIVEIVACFSFFIYMFNRRYEDIEQIRKRRDNNQYNKEEEKTDFQRKHVESEDIELPKQVDKKKF